MATYITIDINSDCDPVTYLTDTDEEIAVARRALRDAGLAYEDIYVGDPDGEGDSHRNGNVLFAAASEAV